MRGATILLLCILFIYACAGEDDVQSIEVDVSGHQKNIEHDQQPDLTSVENERDDEPEEDEEELRLLEELIQLKQKELELKKKQKGKSGKGPAKKPATVQKASHGHEARSTTKPKQVQKPSAGTQSQKGKRPIQRKNVAVMSEAELSAYDDGDGDYLVPVGIHEGPSVVTAAAHMLANAREGMSEWVATGDDEGTLRVINKDGSVAATFEEPGAGAVKYLLSGPKNEAYFVAFHADGRLRMYRIHKNRVPKSKGSTKNLEHVLAPVTMDRTHKSEAITDADGNVGGITGLDVIYASAKTYFIVAEANGNISFFNKQLELQNSMNIHREIGTLKRGTNTIAIGSGSSITLLNSKNMNIQNEECHLPDLVEGSTIVSLEYDKARPMVIYAGTSNGEVVAFDASSKSSKKAQCRVIGDVMDLGEIQPVSLSAISGYVMASVANTMTVFNVTGVSRWGVRPCWRRDLGLELGAGENSVVVTNRQLSIMVLGGKYVSLFKSRFPNKNPWDDIMKWKAPLFLLGGAFVIGWQYYRYKKKKDDLERKKIEKQSLDHDPPSYRRPAPADDPYKRYNESNNYGRASDYGRGVGGRYGDSGHQGRGEAGMGINYRSHASAPSATYSDDDDYGSDD